MIRLLLSGAQQARVEHVCTETVRKSLQEHLKLLDQELAAIEREIEALTARD